MFRLRDLAQPDPLHPMADQARCRWRPKSLADAGVGRVELPLVPRVLVTEEIAERGLDGLRAAGYEVDVQLDLSPDDLLAAVKGADALIIRSATQVTAEVLAAGTDLWWWAGPASASTTSTSTPPPAAASWW